MTKLSKERLNELNAVKKEKGLTSIVSLLETSELEAYKVNIEEAKKIAVNNVKKYENTSSYEFYVNRLKGLEKLEAELEKRINAKEEVKVTDKKVKISKAQEKVMNSIKNAKYFYKTKQGEVLHNLYINGEAVESSGAYITEDGNYKVKLNTHTLNSMVKNGLLEVLKLVGDGYDTVKTIQEFEKPEKYDTLTVIELRKVVNPKTGGFFKQTIACPVGQEEQAIKASGLLEERYEVFSKKVENVKVWA